MNNKQFISEDFFYKALIISLSIHLLLVCSTLFVPSKKKAMRINKMEIIYTVPKKAEPPAQKTKAEDVKPTKNEKITPQDPLASVVLIKERQSQQPATLKVYERLPVKNRTVNMDMKKAVSVPALQSEKINNPTYANYYSLVRGRIRQRAYFNYSEYYAGEVYLTFILTNDGVLKDLKIIEERTTGSQYLRTIGLKSIKESDPFPPFPKDLRYPELTFNVVISFQVHEE